MQAYTDKSHMALASTISNLIGEQNEKLARILEQTTKTNGRVTTLETWRATHSVEQGYLTQKLDKVCDTLSRLNWLVLSAVVVGLLGLILK